MQVLKIDKEETKVKYIISVEESNWKTAQDNAFKVLSKDLRLPGFRAGHAPKEAIAKYIDQKSVMEKALKNVIDANYKLLLNDEKFNVDEVIEDSLSVDIQKIDQKNLELIYVFEKFPTITVPDYKHIKIDYSTPEVADHEIQREITHFTKNDHLLFPKENETIEIGDMAIFDFKGYIDNEPFVGGESKDFELEIGSKSFIPGFEEQMVGLKKGQTTTINVTFPNNYHSPHLAGKPSKFELKINDVKRIQKPKLDEEYLSRFQLPNVKNEEDFKKYIHEQISTHKAHGIKQNAISTISEYIIEHSKLSHVPNSLLKAEEKRLNDDITNRASEANVTRDEFITKHLGYKDSKQFETALKKSAEKNLVLVIALEKIISELKLEVTKKELDDHLQKLSNLYKIPVDDIKDKFKNNFEGIKTFILQDKLFDKLIEINKTNK